MLRSCCPPYYLGAGAFQIFPSLKLLVKHYTNNLARSCFHSSHYEKFLATGEVKCIDDEIPFEIPAGWAWCKIKHICTMQAGKNISASKIFAEYSELHPYRCVGGNGLRGYTESYNTSGHYSIVGRQGALCGCLNIENGDFYATEHAVVVDAYDIVPTTFIYYFLTALNLNQYATATAQPGLAVSNIIEVMFPLPPIQEQQRIVEQIKLIMPLVNKYEQSRSKLDSLNKTIYTQLKKSILQEAIQGRLVPQDSNDESASVLLERIREEKQRLLKEGKLKKKDITDSVIFKGDDNKYYEKIGNETVCIDEEIPFDIPRSWSWTRLGFLVSNETGLSYSKDCLSEKSSRMIRVLRGGNIEEGRWLTKDDDVMISASYVKDELILKRGTFITPAVTSIERMAKTALVEVDQSDIVVGGFVLMLKPFIKDDSLLRYLILLFQSVYYKQCCISITNKSGQAFYNLSRQKLMKCLVPIAPIKEMSRIAEKIVSLNL